MYENKPADNIQERTDNDYLSRVGLICLPIALHHVLGHCCGALSDVNKHYTGLFYLRFFHLVVMQLTGALTSVRHVNRTDVVTLGSTFGVGHARSLWS